MGRVIALLVALLLLAGGAPAAELRGRVTWIADGDSLEVEPHGEVRLLGIDTPEYRDSARDRFYRERFGIAPARLRAISRAARQFAIRHLENRTVQLEPGQVRRDRHGRLLAYLYLPDGRMFNRMLLEQGLASVFRRYDFRYKEDFLEVEHQARIRQQGLWSRGAEGNSRPADPGPLRDREL